MTRKHGRRKKFFQGGQSRHVAYFFQIADDAMQIDIPKTLYPFCTSSAARMMPKRP